MGHFADCIKIILTEEGGLSVDARDPGGLTKYGISQRAYPHLDIHALTLDDAEAIYHRDYWAPIQGDEFPAGIALLLFDAAVNQGPATAVKLLQTTLQVTADGIAGPNTQTAALLAMGRAPINTLIDFCAERALRYEFSRNETVFGRGWYRRLFRVYDIARSWSTK